MKNVCEFSGRKSGEWTISRKMTRQKEQEEQAEKQEEIGKGNEMTALRFQTGNWHRISDILSLLLALKQLLLPQILELGHIKQQINCKGSEAGGGGVVGQGQGQAHVLLAAWRSPAASSSWRRWGPHGHCWGSARGGEGGEGGGCKVKVRVRPMSYLQLGGSLQHPIQDEVEDPAHIAQEVCVCVCMGGGGGIQEQGQDQAHVLPAARRFPAASSSWRGWGPRGRCWGGAGLALSLRSSQSAAASWGPGGRWPAPLPGCGPCFPPRAETERGPALQLGHQGTPLSRSWPDSTDIARRMCYII